MPEEFVVLGKRIHRVDADEKVTGQIRYVADIFLPDMLLARFLRSPLAHARIADIDTTKAIELPGVKAVLTHKNIPKVHPFQKMDYLLNNEVCYSGEEVAVVAATSAEIAEKALGMIEVKYEALPAIFDMDASLQSGAPQVRSENINNIFHGNEITPFPGCRPDGWLELKAGDVEKGFVEADYIVEGIYETPIQHPCSPMPRAVVCRWTGDKLDCWIDSQVPQRSWEDMSKCLGIPMSSIRLRVHPVGGYGAKDPERIAVLVALLSKVTRKPVKAQFTRYEDIIATHRRLNYKHYGKVGVKQDGTITAIHNKVMANFGADSRVPMEVLSTSGANTFSRLYHWQNSRFEGCNVMTNVTHHAAVLGFGDPEAAFCLERLMDEVAEKIGMDPLEFRLKNCVKYGDIAFDRFRLRKGVNPVGWGIMGPDILSFPQCIKLVAEKSDWKNKWKGWKTPVKIDGSQRHGIGVSLGMHHTWYTDFSAVVRMNTDGTANVLSNGVEIGQGYGTALAQITAETLGINVSDIQLLMGDTASTPLGIGNIGSCGTSSALAAVKYAAEDARRIILQIAANKLLVHPDELDIKNCRIFVKNNPKRCIAIADVCKTGFQIIGVGNNPPPDTIKDEKTGKTILPYSVGAVVTEVIVDVDTGELTISKISAANDCGKAINPTLIENQIDLALTMANGWVRTERLLIDNLTGVVLNPSLLDYKIMTMMDMPESKNVSKSIVEIPCAWGPFGAKGFSETAMTYVAPSIANAIYNAIGVRMRGPQFTPDEILRVLGK